jgi:DNA-directed RNA polymerase specialized sigma24 family protein
MADIPALWVRLFKLARRKGQTTEMATEMATETIVDMMQRAQDGHEAALEWHYASVALLNLIKELRRNAARREVNLPNKPDDEIAELRRGCPASQDMIVALSDVQRGFDLLPVMSRKVMTYTAIGCEVKEIADLCDIPVSEVYWRTRVSRKILREKGFWDEEKAFKSDYIGIKKECRKWLTAIRVGGKYKHLGSFDTASDAAKAYDAAAREAYGAKAKLNFPEIAA